jgi:hypothetical protein
MKEYDMTDSYTPKIEPVESLLGFFREELVAALDAQGVETSEETEAYLVHLLESYSRVDASKAEEVGFSKPAALLLEEAMHRSGEQRIEAYRRLGDAALYSCGFFEAHLERRGVGGDYYRRVGRTAYSSLTDWMNLKQPGGIFELIYRELTAKFDDVVGAFTLLGDGGKPTPESIGGLWLYGEPGQA